MELEINRKLLNKYCNNEQKKVIISAEHNQVYLEYKTKNYFRSTQ